MRGNERRRIQRLERHLAVTFDARGKRGRALTENVSPGGLLLRSGVPLEPGAHLRGQLVLPGGNELAFEAEVRWTGKTSGTGAKDRPHLLGVEFIGPPDEPYYDFLRQVWDASPAASRKSRKVAGVTVKRGKTPKPGRRVTAWSAAKPGLEGLSVAVHGTTGWPDSETDGVAWWSVGRVAVLIERACERAIMTAVPRGSHTQAHRVEVDVVESPSAVGAKLMTLAWLREVDVPSGALRFDAEVREGRRVLARGSHVRLMKDD